MIGTWLNRISICRENARTIATSGGKPANSSRQGSDQCSGNDRRASGRRANRAKPRRHDLGNDLDPRRGGIETRRELGMRRQQCNDRAHTHAEGAIVLRLVLIRNRGRRIWNDRRAILAMAHDAESHRRKLELRHHRRRMTHHKPRMQQHAEQRQTRNKCSHSQHGRPPLRTKHGITARTRVNSIRRLLMVDLSP